MLLDDGKYKEASYLLYFTLTGTGNCLSGEKLS
jgi:hypothetical protein